MKIHELLQEASKPKPTNPKLWTQAKAQARRKFDVYPSAYANAWAAGYYKRKGGKWRMTESVQDPEIEQFLNSLTADDVGTEQFDHHVVHFEGFGDWCQQDAQDRCNLPSTDPRHLSSYDQVYQEVLNDMIQREQGRQPVEHGFVGSEDYPVLYAIFER